MTNFWQDRLTFVTGATGLVGSWLVKYLIKTGADIVCLVRDWIPQSLLIQSNTKWRFSKG
jgi:CDP-glucose 4,6-dehydratase